ncbi:hypothetical protein Ancab_020394 [Ancistrocladus abbreviatus]
MQKSEAQVIGLEYWLQWQVPLCALIILLPVVIAVNIIKKSKKTTIDSLSRSDLWLPCWRRFSPTWLLIYRAFAFVCMACLLYQMVAFAGIFAFYFYTQWTFALVMVYFAVGTIISAQGCQMYSKKPTAEAGEMDKFLKNESEDLKHSTNLSSMAKKNNTGSLQKHYNPDGNSEKPGFLGHFMHIVYQVSAGASVLTDIVFWCILVPMLSGKESEVTLLIGSIHSMNAVFLLIDSLLNSLPFEWLGFAYFVLWSALYIAFQWVLHACGFTWWPYPFLELSTPWAPVWYFGLALFHVPCYGLYLLVMTAKASSSRLFPHAFPRSFTGTLHQKKAA